MDESKLREKQQFLSEEIIEVGYDPEEFQDFMLKNSNKALDLNQWQIEQLSLLVGNFKKKKQEENFKKQDPKNENQQSDNQQEYEQQQKNKSVEIQQSKPFSQKSHSTKLIEEMQVDQIKNYKNLKTSKNKYLTIKKKSNVSELYILTNLQKKKVEIKIKKFTKTVPNNIFKASYVQYEIECSEGWKVTRRFNDFIWLRKYFEKMYNGFPIPPIPEKTAFRSFDEKHIKFRMKALEKFLQEILRSPELCSDPIIDNFLRADPQYFTQTQRNREKEMQQKQQSTIVESIFGENVLERNHQKISAKKCVEYDELGNKYETLCQKFITFQEAMKKVVSESFSVASSFQQIESKLYSPKGKGIYNVMFSFFNQFGVHISNTLEQIENNISSVWNFESMNISNINEGMYKVVKQEANLQTKQKSLMQQGKSQKSSEQMKELQIGKQRYYLKLSNTLRELERYENENLKLIADNWTKNLRVYIAEVSNWMIDCTDQLTRSMSIGEGKELMEVQYKIK